MAVGREIALFEHGFVRLDDAMASDLSVVNSARVSFAKRRDAMDDGDAGLVRFLMRERHGTPFAHNAFRFHVRCPNQSRSRWPTDGFFLGFVFRVRRAIYYPSTCWSSASCAWRRLKPRRCLAGSTFSTRTRTTSPSCTTFRG